MKIEGSFKPSAMVVLLCHCQSIFRGLPGHPWNSDRGMSDHTGDSNNSNSF